MSTAKKPAKPAPAKNQAPAPASAAKSKGTGDAEVDGLAGRIKGLELSKQLAWGFNFNCPLPYFWWTYNFGGIRHLKMEILMAVTWHQDIVPSVSESGEYLIVYCKIPDYFLNVGRLLGYYHDPNAAAPGPTFSETDSMFSEGVIATREIKASLETIGGANQSVPIKLPFKVLSNFIDPYNVDGNQTGFGLRSYPHEKNPVGGQVKFTVLSVTMQDAKSVRVRASLNHQDVDVDANVMGQYA